jgi:diaminohydroxyphosphoribosylaminopyrimidine deaminase/5-amino-6-(5-phosphoribosylamino)uracil reductase
LSHPLLQRAIELAEHGWGRVQPNPLVGAVVADAQGNVLGEGYHAVHGGPHAEIVALKAAGANSKGATLFVSLEPCSHHGRTPPCTDVIRQAGISHVIYGAADPNPVAAGGAKLLRTYGIEVIGPLATDAVRRQNAIFFHAHEQRRPFVALKLACSLDGRIAATGGKRTLITGDEAQAETHRLRAGYDAVMIGSGTALADDPLLTVRRSVIPVKPPIRVVLDTNAVLSPTSNLATTTREAATWLFCAPDAAAEKTAALAQAGVRILTVARTGAGLDLAAVLGTLWDNGIRSVFCEGGARMAGTLARAGRIDRFYLLLAPRLLGPDAVNAFDALPTAMPLALSDVRRFGSDVMLTYDRGSGSVHPPSIASDVEGYVHGTG